MNEHTAQDELERKLLAWSRKKRNRVTLEYFFGMRDSIENNKSAKVCGTCDGLKTLYSPDHGTMAKIYCPACNGTGREVK